MNRPLAVLLLFIATQSDASDDPLVIASPRSHIPVAVSLEVGADYVAVPVSITSGDKDALRNIENVQALSNKLRGALAKAPDIKLRQGAISLSIMPGEESSFSSSYSAPNPTASTSLFLAVPLTKSRDVFQAARELLAIAQSVAKPEPGRVSYGTTSLGLESPERFRSRLLALIQKDVTQVRSALGSQKTFEVSGLENPVLVMQRDDKNVAVYIPYRLKIGP